MADTQVLEACASAWGFESPLPHQNLPMQRLSGCQSRRESAFAVAFALAVAVALLVVIPEGNLRLLVLQSAAQAASSSSNSPNRST
jgi:hypothetical protein